MVKLSVAKRAGFLLLGCAVLALAVAYLCGCPGDRGGEGGLDLDTARAWGGKAVSDVAQRLGGTWAVAPNVGNADEDEPKVDEDEPKAAPARLGGKKDGGAKGKDSAFACLPREDTEGSRPKRMSPLVIFGEPRVGSNLFFNMMRERNILAARNSGGHPYDVETMGLYDFFHGTAEKDQMQANNVLKKVRRDCRSESGEEIAGLPAEIQAALDEKYDNPRVMFDALDGLPSYADRGYYTFKIFSKKIYEFLKGGDPSTLVRAASERKNADAAPAKYIVMWRRRMIESFVSEELAIKTGARTSRSKHYLGEEAPKIHVKKEKMEEYIDTQRKYYESVKRALEDAGVKDYLVLEYGADFLEAEQHLATVRKLESFLGASGDSLAEKTVERLGHEKQQKGDISTAVENWDEVVKNGWGGELEEWEDLFESHRNPDF